MNSFKGADVLSSRKTKRKTLEGVVAPLVRPRLIIKVFESNCSIIDLAKAKTKRPILGF